MSSDKIHLWEKSAVEVIALLKNKEISPKEVLDSTLNRINETHKSINAVVTLCKDRAIKQIQTINSRMKNHPGYLNGLPVVIKDLTDVSGVKTTYGSKIFYNHIPIQA